jgi:hypothetical protein
VLRSVANPGSPVASTRLGRPPGTPPWDDRAARRDPTGPWRNALCLSPYQGTQGLGEWGLNLRRAVLNRVQFENRSPVSRIRGAELQPHISPVMTMNLASWRFSAAPRPRDRRHDAPVSARCGRTVPVQRQDAKIPDHRSTLRPRTGQARTGSRIQAMGCLTELALIVLNSAAALGSVQARSGRPGFQAMTAVSINRVPFEMVSRFSHQRRRVAAASSASNRVEPLVSKWTRFSILNPKPVI